jgi:predicted ferric reductase
MNRIRRSFYEVFFQSHFWATILVAGTLLKHIAQQRRTSRLYILIGIGVWSVLFSFRFIVRCLRNIGFGKGAWTPKVSVKKVCRTITDDQLVLRDAYHLHLWLNRSLTIQPGQHLYVTVPWVSLASMWQSHPFLVVWWHSDSSHSGMHLQMLVRPRHGITRRLMSCRDKQYSAWIEGPYGQSRDLTTFRTVLMFAADIGIAVHMSYLKCLVETYRASAIGPKRIVVVWEVRDYSESPS